MMKNCVGKFVFHFISTNGSQTSRFPTPPTSRDIHSAQQKFCQQQQTANSKQQTNKTFKCEKDAKRNENRMAFH